MREPGEGYKEEITSGTSAALAGGFTMVLAAPNTNPALVDETGLNLTENLYEQNALCDYGLFAGANSDNSSRVSNLAARTLGLQMYLNQSFNSLNLKNIDAWLKHFKTWPSHLPICCHAQDESLVGVLFFCELFNRHVHICEVATKQDIEVIKLAKEKGLKVTCHVTPHHLFLTERDTKSLGSQVAAVRPNLKSEEDQKALWDNLDIIDIISSDHAPHTLLEKQECGYPGFPGLETTLTLLLTACKEKKISIDTIVQKCYTNPRNIFNLPEQEDTFIEIGKKLIKKFNA